MSTALVLCPSFFSYILPPPQFLTQQKMSSDSQLQLQSCLYNKQTKKELTKKDGERDGIACREKEFIVSIFQASERRMVADPVVIRMRCFYRVFAGFAKAIQRITDRDRDRITRRKEVSEQRDLSVWFNVEKAKNIVESVKRWASKAGKWKRTERPSFSTC